MADGVQRGFIEIWELALATMFFLAVLSAILVVFDNEEYEKTLFSKELKEIVTIMPQNTTISLQLPEFVEVSLEKSSQTSTISITKDNEEENPITFKTTKAIEITRNQGVLTLTT